MSKTKELTKNLTSQYYYALWQKLGKPDGFMLATGSVVVEDQPTLDQIADAIPPLSLNNSFSGNPINTFSGNYRGIVPALNPPAAVATALGTQYNSSWLTFLKKNAAKVTFSPPDEYVTSLQGLMRQWGVEDAIPQDVVDRGVTALVQDIDLNPVSMATTLLAAAKDGPFGWTPNTQNLQTLMANAETIGFDITDIQKSTDLTHTWAEGAMNVFYDIFDFGAEGSYESEAKSFMSNAFAISVSMGQVSTMAVPIQVGQSFSIAGTDYRPWYDPAALRYAYKGQNNANVWKSVSDWGSYFGDGGTLPRLITELYFAQDIQITMTSSYSFSASQYKKIEAAAATGFFPFFVGEVSGERISRASQSEDGTVALTTSSPTGVTMLIGVNVASVADLMGT